MTMTMTAAEALLRRLKFHGVNYLLANAGTDFAPLIEAYESYGDQAAEVFPQPVVIPHETAAVAMAHSYYLMTGEPLAVMVHVNVGLANCIMGLLNAQSDQVPLIMLAGRTPVTEYQRHGSRMTPIQYGQEMRDQSAMVREAVKWDYELRYGEQIVDAIDRAHAVAMSAPRGPVFLSLPREPLAESIAGGRQPDDPRIQQPAASGSPDPLLIADMADQLLQAERPLIICQRGDVAGRLTVALAEFATELAIPVVEPFPIRNVLSAEHPMHLGYQLGNHLADADVILVIDSPVPWIARHTQPHPDAVLLHIGPDPLFSHLPMRSHPSDLALQADPAQAIEALTLYCRPNTRPRPDSTQGQPELTLRQERGQTLTTQHQTRLAAQTQAMQKLATQTPILPAYVAHILGHHLDDDAVVFSELGPPPGPARVKDGNRWFTPPFSGGLGWGLPAALGAKLAHPDKLIINCVGDGSYLFANPVACHQIAEALGLPILTIVLNNSAWNATRRAALNMYPGGAASRPDKPVMTDLSPSPDFLQVAAASRAWTARVEDPKDLDATLKAAIAVVQGHGDAPPKQALIEIITAKTDGF